MPEGISEAVQLMREIREQVGVVDAKLDLHHAELTNRLARVERFGTVLRHAAAATESLARVTMEQLEERMAALEMKLNQAGAGGT